MVLRRRGIAEKKTTMNQSARVLFAALVLLVPCAHALGQQVDEPAKSLLELAKGKFGELTQAERLMFEKTEQGEEAVCGFERCWTTGSDDTVQPPLIRADRIQWLCTDAQAKNRVTHRGIQVAAARFEGKLDLRFARIRFPLCFFDCAFTGPIDLTNAEVRGLYLNGSHTKSISADGVKVEGGVFLRNGFSADGEVRLVSASICGNLSCVKATFSNPKRKDDDNGHALNADGVKVEGYVLLRDGFSAIGGVRLLGSSIGGSLECDNATFSNPGGVCLNADGVKVEGAVFIRNRFEAHGRVSFVAAEVKQHFQWYGVKSPGKATMDLRSAKLGTLWDDANSWPKPGNLYLQGLKYDEIDHDAPCDAKSRIRWLRLQPPDAFSPQPYEQLADVLKKQGHERAAKDILVAKNEDPAFRRGMPWWLEGWYRLYGPTTGYGHRPLRALKGFALFLALGCVLFGLGYCCGLITPSNVDTYAANDGTEPGDISPDYPKFNFIMYSIDTFVPIMNFHQQGYWLPNPNQGVIQQIPWIPLSAGGFLRFYLWFHIAAGWVLTTLFVVGLTGLIRS